MAVDGIAQLEKQVADLAARLRELEDKEAIRELMNHYAFLVDASKWRDIPEEIFTEDGVDFHLPEADPPVITRGHKELLEFFDRVNPTFAGSQHMLGNCHVEIDGDEAYSRTYVIASHWAADDTGEPPRPAENTMAAAFDDKWRRTSKGWRIYERRLHVWGPSGLLFGEMMAAQPRIGTDLFGSRDRELSSAK